MDPFSQTSIAISVRTACYRALLRPIFTWVVAIVLMMPAVVAAQQSSASETDKKRILSCIQSVERTVPLLWSYGLPSKGSEDTCVLAETDRCVRNNKYLDRPIEVTKNDCAAAELKIWQQLLKESYDSAVVKLSEFDSQHTTPDAALPRFKTAHRAWEDWSESECQYNLATTKEGTDRPFIYTWCTVVMTARRVLYYRSPFPFVGWP